ncbi:MAG: MFS transporter [Bacteroidia bacterium]|nr:MFS transporter [Bacteroidia bacterium]
MTVFPEKLPFTSYQKILIAILALIQFTVVLDFMVLSPLSDILMKSLSISPQQFGMVVSVYAISAFVSGISTAGFADKYDRKKLLLFFYVGFVLGTLLCGLANSYWALLAARLITGLFGGVIASISMAIVTDIFSLSQRGRVMGFIQMAFAGSQVLGIPISLAIAAHFNWHYTFLAIVVFAIVLGLVVLIKMKPIDEHLKLQSDKNAFLHLWHTFTNKSYQVGFVATAMLSIGGFMLMPFGSAFLVNNVSILQTELPLVFMFTGMSSIIIMPIIGKLSDKFDKFKLFTVGSVIAVIMVIVYTNIPVIPLWQVILVNMLLFMGIMSRMVPATALATAIPDAKDRGAFMSINSSLQQLAGGIAAIFAGFIVKQETKTSPLEHYDTLGYIVATLILICLFFVYRVSVLVKSKTLK